MIFKTTHQLIWKHNKLTINGQKQAWFDMITSKPIHINEQLNLIYKDIGMKYPKFHKMDLQSKVAILAIELMNIPFKKWNPYNIAMLFDTQSGSITADKAFEASRTTFPSPALFVYTLPNIFMGEIAIRHEIKGPHICLQLDPESTTSALSDRAEQILRNKKADVILWGQINATEEEIDVKINLSVLSNIDS
ncbi:MAG TPA: hypothetical protein VFD78_06715 [Chitinophagaceae bacterium]|nr:hypothetical protein [Chitinophagaceae bacterium]